MQMIVTDLDRTLLRTDKSLSARSVQTLSCMRSRGIKLVLATARPVRTVKKYLQMLPCDAVIYHNGALTMADGKPFGGRYPIAIEMARTVLGRLCAQNPARKISVELDDTLYANFDVDSAWNNAAAVSSDFTDLPDRDADKILVEIANEDEYREICAFLPPELYGEISDQKLCLIMNRQATKRNAVQALAQAWGIRQEEIVAFGDDLNDIGMLRWCGLGVAMANALDPVKQVADACTRSNDEDGVADFPENRLP